SDEPVQWVRRRAVPVLPYAAGEGLDGVPLAWCLGHGGPAALAEHGGVEEEADESDCYCGAREQSDEAPPPLERCGGRHPERDGGDADRHGRERVDGGGARQDEADPVGAAALVQCSCAEPQRKHDEQRAERVAATVDGVVDERPERRGERGGEEAGGLVVQAARREESG